MRRAILVGTWGVLAACARFGTASGAGDESPDGGDGGLDTADARSPSDAVSDSPTPDGGCGGTATPTMVSVGAFCIDSTEVTNSDYDAFLKARNGDTSGQPPACASHTSFARKCPQANNALSAPVTCVAWCDAYAYCAWAGKRLCGRVGGGPNVLSADTLTIDQWYFACSAGGDQPVPYGGTFKPGQCNDKAFDAGGPVTVETPPGCVGGFPGLFDMSGNVMEWEDSCTDAGGDYCALRGGSFADTAPELLECGSNFPQDRETANDRDGFRCCSR